jgi:DNA-binding SARP family transcriptional activator
MGKEIAIGAGNHGQLAARRGAVSFRLLGAFQLIAGGQPQWAGPEQEQRLLVKLTAARGMPVANEELMKAIWDEVPGPGATLDALYHLVAAARKRLATVRLDDVLTNTNGTYRLDVPEAHVDLHVFRALTARASGLARAGDPQAIAVYERALQLRAGEPLAGLRGQWIDGFRHTITEELRAAELASYETAIRHGESRERLPGLSTLQRDRPDDELVAWLYMHALYRAGLQTKALAVKREFSDYLLETAGLSSGKALDDLYQRILAEDDDLLAPEAVSFPVGEAGKSSRPPRRPAPDAGQRGSHEEPPADSADVSPDDPAHGERQGAATTGPSLVFNAPVHARYGVFGTQVNHGGPR